jgi:chromosome condensin MukBEF complex kleisin-like MukF subunit
MGASSFSLRIKADSLQSAYQQAYDQAVHEYGHNIYSGTIATTNGVIDKTDVLTQLVKEEQKYAAHDEVGAALRNWRSEAWDNTIKWDSVWGAKIPEMSGIADNEYILAGWAAE